MNQVSLAYIKEFSFPPLYGFHWTTRRIQSLRLRRPDDSAVLVGLREVPAKDAADRNGIYHHIRGNVFPLHLGIPHS